MHEEEDNATTKNNRHTEHKGRSVPLFDFNELFGDEAVVLIRLGTEVYELRKTRTGKLLLNK